MSGPPSTQLDMDAFGDHIFADIAGKIIEIDLRKFKKVRDEADDIERDWEPYTWGAGQPTDDSKHTPDPEFGHQYFNMRAGYFIEGRGRDITNRKRKALNP